MAFANKTIVEIAVTLFISLLISFSTKANDIIKLGSQLSPRNTTSSYWLSRSRIFAFGFHPQNDSLYSIAIVMFSKPNPTVVWTTQNESLSFSADATMELTTQGLRVIDPKRQGIRDLIVIPAKNDIPWPDGSLQVNITSAASVLDSGNFVLFRDSNGENDSDNRTAVWESFEFPSDTLLGGQNLSSGRDLVSSGSGFRLGLSGGTLVLFAPSSSDIGENRYWQFDTFEDSVKLCLNSSGFLYLTSYYLRSKTFILANGLEPESRENNGTSFIYRATLDSDGIFRLYLHEDDSSGVEIWSALSHHCDVKGFCGFNSYCSVGDGNKGAECHCYPGFDFVDESNTKRGCYQSLTQQSCESETRYDISNMTNVLWGDYPYSSIHVENENFCANSCLDDCNCWAASYTTRICQKFRLPLRYGKRNQNISTLGFFKVGSNTNPFGTDNHTNPMIGESNRLILILGTSLGSVLCLLFLLAFASFAIYVRRVKSYKRLAENANLGLDDDFSLQQFSYTEIESATNGFSEELGRGSFGAVYKGKIGQRNVAVKRLESVVEEGVREFRAEITTIGQTHHRNLVHLVGFCIERSKRLLVYEFMNNGALSDFLFKSNPIPSWRDRVRLALDVARGLFYLHEECGVHIIHCNLKPQNIMLDENFTAKISDFGFARLIKTNQEEESKGYDAPEWKKNALISVKSDVYSYGVTLLEIVCCRRNIDIKVSREEEIVLWSWVYKCYVNGELNKIVELNDDYEMRRLERMVKVGLWCVQDDPSLRPIMKNVILMLEGTMDIPVPPSPELPLR